MPTVQGLGAATTVLPWLALWLLAVAVRAAYVHQIGASPLGRLLLGDSAAYDRWARTLLAGDWIGHEVFFQAPLYPYFLGVLYRLGGTDLAWVRSVQVVLGATSCLFLGRAGAAFFTPAVGLVAGTLLALDPTAIYFDALIQKNVLDGFFFTLLLWALGRLVRGAGARWWLVAGLALGFLGLTRENALVLIALVLVWSAIQFRDRPPVVRLRAAGALLLGVVLVLAPVALRNFAVGGELHLTTSQFGLVFYLGNNPAADGTYQPLRFGRSNALFEHDDATALAEEAVGHALTPGEVSSYWLDRGLTFVRAQPAAWLRLLLRKWLLVWNATEIGDSEDQYTFAEWSPLLHALTAVLHFGVICPLAVLGIVLTWDERRRLWLLPALLVTYAASVSLFFIFARYRFSLVPPLLLFAAAGLVRAVALVHEHRLRPLVPAAAAAACAAVLVNWPLLDRDRMRAMTYYNIGGHLAEEGDAAHARELFRKAVARDPDFALAYQQLGVALFGEGDLAGAEEQFATAVRLKPDFTDARHNLATVLFRLGRLDEAIANARATLAVDPGMLESRNLLGRALLAAGRPAEAVGELETLVRADPAYRNGHAVLGQALVQAGRPAEAIAHFRAALRLSPDAAEIRYQLGDALARAGQVDAARAELEAALGADPTLLDAHIDLAKLLGAQGDEPGSVRHLEAALRLAQPGSDEAARVADLLRAHGH